jgi:type I restriction enzyme M protein
MSNLGFEETLWKTADKLRNNMDAAEYKHVVLGLIFLKYISDSFYECRERLKEKNRDLEDPDEYLAKKTFFVPKKARWDYIQSNAKQSNIGVIIDEAMEEIEDNNSTLKTVLPKNYSRQTLDKRKLGELIDLVGTIGLGDKESRSEDILGRVYEYFLGKFADKEGKNGGEFYTPSSIVKTLVYMLRPYKGRVYDPCCGSGGMFVSSKRFVKEHSLKIDNIHVYGQESNPTTWKLCNMNLAIRHIFGNIKLGDSFHNDQHKDLRADYILANPPFNISDWGGEHLEDDVRWKYGVPPKGNANYAWIQHIIYHLSSNGVAGFVLANGSVSSNTSNEGKIRKNILEADLVDCIVALPSKLFYNTMIPCCLWFIRKDKSKSKINRKNQVLFIDARNLGKMINRRNKILKEEDILKIANTYHLWRGEDPEKIKDQEKNKEKRKKYENILGFCKSETLEEIKNNNYMLTPGRYVGIEIEKDDGIPFEEKMKKLTTDLSKQMEKGKELDQKIKKNLESLGFKVI